MRYNPQQIETCVVQCSPQCSHKTSLRDVIAQSLRDSSWSQALNGSFQKSFLVAAKLLVEMIDIVRVCPCSLRDETLRSNVWNILKRGHNSTWNDKTLLAQLMLLADSGFYFHLSRLVNLPEEYQYMQVLFAPNVDLILVLKPGGDDDRYLRALPKLLGLPSLVSYVDIKEFVTEVHESSHDLFTFKQFFETFQRDPARSGEFYHDPARWHAFAATRFLRFLATASSW